MFYISYYYKDILEDNNLINTDADFTFGFNNYTIRYYNNCLYINRFKDSLYDELIFINMFSVSSLSNFNLNSLYENELKITIPFDYRKITIHSGLYLIIIDRYDEIALIDNINLMSLT